MGSSNRFNEGEDHVQGSTRQQGSEKAEEGTGQADGTRRLDADGESPGADSVEEIGGQVTASATHDGMTAVVLAVAYTLLGSWINERSSPA
jgi:phage-related minor tail protein